MHVPTKAREENGVGRDKHTRGCGPKSFARSALKCEKNGHAQRAKPVLPPLLLLLTLFFFLWTFVVVVSLWFSSTISEFQWETLSSFRIDELSVSFGEWFFRVTLEFSFPPPGEWNNSLYIVKWCTCQNANIFSTSVRIFFCKNW